MAYPKIINAQVFNDKVILTFSLPMKLSNLPPPEAFSLTEATISSASWLTNSVFQLQLASSVVQDDLLFLSYTRPTNDAEALQASNLVFVESFDFLELFNFSPREEDKTNYNLSTDYPAGSNDPHEAYVSDFIQMFGKREAVQLTNLDFPSAQEVRDGVIESALRDAGAYIDNYIAQASRAGKLLVASTRKRTQCIIARYYLDAVRRRKDVLEDYERAIKELELNSLAFRDSADLAINNGGILRTKQVPQVYNPITGKGFGGWWVRLQDRDNPDYRDQDVNNRPIDGGGYEENG